MFLKGLVIPFLPSFSLLFLQSTHPVIHGFRSVPKVPTLSSYPGNFGKENRIEMHMLYFLYVILCFLCYDIYVCRLGHMTYLASRTPLIPRAHACLVNGTPSNNGHYNKCMLYVLC